MMEGKILQLLKDNPGFHLSGEEISRQLRLSRTSVWETICRLRQNGYAIEAVSGRGYRLQSLPDLVTPLEISADLKTKRLGRIIHYYPELDSTNSTARALAQAGAAEGTLVIAEKQRAGRGRLGRDWSSPPGGIWLSLILRPPLSPFKVQGLTLLAAVAAVEATGCLTGLKTEIKWPNDLLINGKKLAGILTEVSAEMEQLHYVVLGLGLNANVPLSAYPAAVAARATSLWAETKGPVQRAAWVQLFLQQFEEAYLAVPTEGLTDILRRWRTYAVTLGQAVVVHGAKGKISGQAVDITEQGALVVETTRGREIFWAGDISLTGHK